MSATAHAIGHAILTATKEPQRKPPMTAHPIALVRLTVAGIIAAHGWARWAAGGVAPFGVFLDSQGLPYSAALAWGVTLFEMAGSAWLAWGRWPASLLALVFAAIYGVGIALVHAKAGWFVVGLGRNGMEFSVLLIVCLLAVAWQGWRRRG
jgi:putative oxidoreductase